MVEQMVSDLPAVKRRKRKWLIAAGAVVLVAVLCFGGWVFYSLTPSFYGPGPIGLVIEPDKPSFNQGEPVTFTVTVVNEQAWPITHPNSEWISIKKDGVPYSDTGASIDYVPKTPTYPASTNSTYTWTWIEQVENEQKVPHDIGNYTLNYRIMGYEYDAAANCTFIIK